MTDAKQSVLDRAESLARRVLERVGSKVDDKLAPDVRRALSPQVIGDLTSRAEHVIDASLKEDASGIRRVAPNRLKVLFTYEETSELTPQYLDAVGEELSASLFEYINNRRYVTLGPVEVKATRDLFAKSTTIRASFDDEASRPSPEDHSDPAQASQQPKSICLTEAHGRSHRIELSPEGTPAYLGRAAGAALRIDDPSISRLHCSIALRSDGNVVIGDLGSANGTLVNREPLGRDEARALKSGDKIVAGDFELTVSEIF